MRVVLHIGAGKCGSSALQAALSARPESVRANGEVIRFGILTARGAVRAGARLGAAPEISGYHASVGADGLDALNRGAVAREVAAAGGTLVLSNESWSKAPAFWKAAIRAAGVDATAVMYVRPQPGYVNASWWQWGAWSGLGFGAWVKRELRRSDWAAVVEAWKRRCPDIALRVRVPGPDIVADFHRHILRTPVPDAAVAPVNQTLPAAVLRLYQRNPVLRPRPHTGGMDFVLGRALPAGQRPLWVIDRDSLRDILATSAVSNRRLLEHLDPDAAAAVERDPRWWTEAAYAGLDPAPPDTQPPDRDALRRLCADLGRALGPETDTSMPVAHEDEAILERTCVDLAQRLMARARNGP